MKLLQHQDLISTRRNRQLADLAADARRRPQRMRALEENDLDALDADFRNALDAFVARYGDLSCAVTGAVDCAPDTGTLAHLILETARLPGTAQDENETVSTPDLESAFSDACPSSMEAECRQLLSLARSSYCLRDDDNIIAGNTVCPVSPVSPMRPAEFGPAGRLRWTDIWASSRLPGTSGRPNRKARKANAPVG